MLERLQLLRNELARATLRRSVLLAGHLMRRQMRQRIAHFQADQLNLRRHYAIADDTPIRGYDDITRTAVESFAATRNDVRFAYTSGSTGRPKKLAYPRSRIRAIKRNNLSTISRTMLRFDTPRAALFILGGHDDDDSLSSLLLSDRGGEPPYLSSLLMPARYLAQPAFRRLIERFGATAARLLLLTVSNPSIVYSTNPSTLALFLTSIYDRWHGSTALIRAYCAGEDLHGERPAVDAALRRIAAPGWRKRLIAISAATKPTPMQDIAPGFRIYYCWDGGYTTSFVKQIQQFLPAPRFRLVPMYSMSTETVETLPYFTDSILPPTDSNTSAVRYLAIAPEVLYEFLHENETDTADNAHADEPMQLLLPWQLVAGKTYSMVVSDPYGLSRYQTEDLFLCAGHVGDVPDLRFLRRRGLTYSFTGEKLTAPQLSEAFRELTASIPQLETEGITLTLIPSRPNNSPLPRYRLVLAHSAQTPPRLDSRTIERQFESILGALNGEFLAKRSSGRLGPTRAIALPYDVLAAHLDPKTQTSAHRAARVWDTQFKLMPLYRRLWNDYGLEGD